MRRRGPKPKLGPHVGMTPADLFHFRVPVRLKDLPGHRDGGHSEAVWLDLVCRAHDEGLICSPGRTDRWALTEIGRLWVDAWLASGAAA